MERLWYHRRNMQCTAPHLAESDALESHNGTGSPWAQLDTSGNEWRITISSVRSSCPHKCLKPAGDVVALRSDWNHCTEEMSFLRLGLLDTEQSEGEKSYLASMCLSSWRRLPFRSSRKRELTLFNSIPLTR